jgi:hypothetical protein
VGREMGADALLELGAEDLVGLRHETTVAHPITGP